ncbi:uncharacterized protein LOC142321586 isoform X2 [Lycorma delicatula]|uniref:uncharacterized protein LOC142321586 isoform X2 n=1 Tax=Lycorma delicatula TaxID=130591 RepID=UPI003F50E568
MEGSTERECSALGGLFQQIITDLKNGTPLWEDLVAKATKLHTCLRATINAIAAYLDAFQKIADAATNTRGATKEIGTALTRICLRHKAVEARMKTFSSAIMDCLVIPLQEKLEDWKKAVVNLDKEHAKDYKRARAELKKRSTDTLRLQKKAKKCAGSDLQRRVESSLQDVTERRHILEETEKKAVRAALIEERSRFCLLVAFLKPVVDEEVAMLSELSHLQEVVDQLEKHTADPYTLPPASEQVITDLKCIDNTWTFQTPPSSPSSLGSRKSSMCSISSLNSSSSGSTKSHHSPSHHYWHRSLSQCNVQGTTVTDQNGSSTPSTGFVTAVNSNSGSASPLPNPTATWPNLQETLQFERAATAIMNERPHTISSAYERGHQRPPLTVYTFHAPEGSQQSQSQPASPIAPTSGSATPVASSQPPIYARPPIPQRCSSLERPSVPSKHNLSIHFSPSNKLDNSELGESPMYVNMSELANLAASKAQEMSFPLPPPPPELTNEKNQGEGQERDGSTSESSLESSSGYGSQTIPPTADDQHNDELSYNPQSGSPNNYCTLPRSNPELHKRPSISTGYSVGTMRGTLLRRGSVQGQKPPPPIRRTSSISINSKQNVGAQGSPGSGGSFENLPPPPPFLLESDNSGRGTPPGNSPSISSGISMSSTGCEVQRNVASSIAAEIQKRNAASVSEYQRTAALGIAAELQRKVAQNGGEVLKKPLSTETIYGEKKTKPLTEGCVGISVAETVRTLTELKHQPASPVSVRRTHSLRSQSCDRRVETGLIATLSAKLAPTLSPRHSRRCSQEPLNSPRSTFQNTGMIRASRVRQWIAVRTVADPAICHDSLMDQIKRGTSLKKTRTINDRSAPQIH